MPPKTDKFASIKIWRETKQILDFIRTSTGQTMAELINELAHERWDKVKDAIKDKLR